MLTIRYMDRKGAGCVRNFETETELAAFCDNLRAEAFIERDGEKIGEVYRLDFGAFDDGRRRWGWYFESNETPTAWRSRPVTNDRRP